MRIIVNDTFKHLKGRSGLAPLNFYENLKV